MKLSLYIPIYSLTLLLSALLLFSVQPMFAKMILPLLGGAPQVWNTAMMFFQFLLLAGYAYAHIIGKYLGLRLQVFLHTALLLAFAIVLPVSIPEGALPPAGQDPVLWQLILMVFAVGGPFFVLAASAPMLQNWFAGSQHPEANNPYFLYGASNLGSMTALLAYPFVIEPLMDITLQSRIWATGYGILITLILFSAALVWKNKSLVLQPALAADDPGITWRKRLQWLILAFIPSSLMLGVTTFITTDIASVPLLWIVPFALYVGTFIIAFSRQPLISSKKTAFIQGFFMIALIAQMISFNPDTSILILLHLSLFFFSALVCHLELASSRPAASRLTEFYLMMLIGGALGGFFNAIIAPHYFIIPYEYAMALAAACFMRHASVKEAFQWKLSLETVAAGLVLALGLTGLILLPGIAPGILAFILSLCLAFLIEKRWLFAIAIAGCLFLYPPGYVLGYSYFKSIVHQDRNFFGVLRVIDTVQGERLLMHGTTHHGSQALDKKYRLTPISYYYKSASPLSDTFSLLDRKRGHQDVAVFGLGIGVTACYQKQGRHFDFFEINPKVIEIAENPDYFTFLKDCGSPYRVITGDGRLTLSGQADHSYDMIFLDAFSSDNIPVHLLTGEAIDLYLRKLRPGGLLVFHISNNYLDIEPVLADAAAHIGMEAYARFAKGGKIEGTDYQYFPAHYLVLTSNEKYLDALGKKGWSPAMTRKGVYRWTDKYSNIVSVLRNKSAAARMRALKE